MTRNIRLRKLFSATVALTLALCMLLPTSVFARQEWDGAIVDYDNSGDHLWITNRDDQSQEDVYCIHPTRAYSSKGKNGNYRYRYNLNNNAWLFDNSQRINVNDGIKSDYMLTSANLDRLAKVIYEGQRQNLSYENMHKAVYWAVVYGMADPNQTIRGGGYVGAIYGNKNNNPIRDVLIAAYSTTQLPDNWKLWLYVPESGAGNGNLQNAVNLTYNTTPSNPKKVKVQFKLKKELDGEGAPELKGGEFTFVFTGPNGFEERVTNAADGTITSPVLEFNENMLSQGSDGQQKTFPFVITEEEGSDSNITYDDKKVDVDVNVQKRSSDGELVVNIWGRNFANSIDNSETPAIFDSTINTFTNVYTKPEAGPGTKASSSAAATVDVPAGQTIDLTLKDEVKYSGLDSSKTYTMVSTLTTGKSESVETKTTDISNATEGTETIVFSNLTSTGEYYIKTELKEGDKVVFTHNGSLDEKSEMAIVTQGEAPVITNTTASIGGVASTKSKPAEYTLGATASSEGVAASFKDKVYFKNLTEGETYTVECIVYKDGMQDGASITKDNITSETASPVEIDLGDISDFGTYTILTNLKDSTGTTIATHNGDLKENSETVKVVKSPYDPKITNTTATLDGINASKFNPITKNVGEGATPNYSFTDEVGFWGLDPDETYSIVSTLYKNGEEQTGTGKVVTTNNVKSTTETPFVVTFGNITDTGRYTIKTELKNSQGQVVAVHNGKLNDRAETAIVQDGQELKTTVKVGDKSASSDSELVIGSEVTSFIDTIEYKNLSGGQQYRIVGKLKEIDENGAVVKNEDGSEYNVAEAETVEPADDGGSGTWKLEFDNVPLEPGKKYVVFESAVNIKDGKDTSKHEDPTDKAQTLITKELPVIKISKKFLGGNEVAGADMKLTGGPDEINEVWTSGTSAREFSVKPGDYTLTEVVAPAGLKTVTTKMNFTVDSEGKVTLKTTTVDNGGKITVQEGNHIILEDAPDEPGLVKTVNDDKETTFKSVNGTVEFQIKATVPYGVTSFSIKDDIPKPLLYVEDSLVATLGGKDLLNYDSSTGQYGASATGDTSVEVFVLSPDGPSTIKPEDAWGEEVVLTLKCKINPEEDLSKYKDPVVNVALLEMDGTVLEASDDNEASVLGIYELAENPDANDDEIKGASKKGANTGDDTPIGWAVVGLLSAALALDMMRRRRMN